MMKKIKVFVAMSGGVDSSVSAALLKKAGFLVIGVYMKQWSPKVLSTQCLWKQDRQDAMKVCAKLGIPFLTWDFSKEYEKEVGKYMIESYKKGITPNPDVMCNNVIKFGLFYDKAMKMGADFVATGHYARTSLGSKYYARQQSFSLTLLSLALLGKKASTSASRQVIRSKLVASLINSPLRLLKAKDQNKDQTYFLWGIKKEQLPKIIFPVGGLEKPEVRKLAKKFGLENAEKKDSQGVCFVGQLDMKKFLKEYIKPKKGKIILFKGASTHQRVGVEMGEHDGVYYYTIGQRHGLDIKSGKGPYFVVKKDIKKNIIYVGKEKDLFSKTAKVSKINWLAKPEKFPALLDVKIRYRTKSQKAKLQKNGVLIFNKPAKAVTSGQSAVFYLGQQLIGGGVITL